MGKILPPRPSQTAGFLAVLISYSGPLIIFYHAAQVANMPTKMVASWVWGTSIGEAVGAYLIAAVIIFTIGLSGHFDKLMRHIEWSLSATLSLAIPLVLVSITG